MAVIQESAPIDLVGPPSLIIKRTREAIAARAWEWFNENLDLVLVSRRVAFWTIIVRVKDLDWLFEELFGEETSA